MPDKPGEHKVEVHVTGHNMSLSQSFTVDKERRKGSLLV